MFWMKGILFFRLIFNFKPEKPKRMNAEQIYNILIGQEFFEWYCAGGDFDSHIKGDENCKSKEEILEQIQKKFQCLPEFSDEEKMKRGESLAKEMNIPLDDEEEYDPPRYFCNSGNKSALGLFETAKRILFGNDWK